MCVITAVFLHIETGGAVFHEALRELREKFSALVCFLYEFCKELKHFSAI